MQLVYHIFFQLQDFFSFKLYLNTIYCFHTLVKTMHFQCKALASTNVLKVRMRVWKKEATQGISVEHDKFSFEVTPKEIYYNKDNPICPSCNSSMVLRKARRGKYAGKHFYGCKNYPQCYGIVNIWVTCKFKALTSSPNNFYTF